ncbi:MAG: amidase [Hyphomicrobiales bacterium]|nr:MAG: amidase [Hyphomicrobiales bacterium]
MEMLAKNRYFSPFSPLTKRVFPSTDEMSWRNWCRAFDQYSYSVNSRVSAFTDTPAKTVSSPIGTNFSSYKDLISVKSLKSRFGTESVVVIPENSAAIVNAMEALGIYTLGKVRTTEFGFGDNANDCVNPLFSEFTPAGSSNGSAAAVACGISDISFGTDAGGSIRFPASNCGVVGLMFSSSEKLKQGIVPVSSTLERVGAITRSIDDIIYLWNRYELSNSFPQHSEQLEKIALAAPTLPQPVDEEIFQTYEEYILRLRAAGVHVERVDLQGWSQRQLGWKIMAYEISQLFNNLESCLPIGRLLPSTKFTLDNAKHISSDEYQEACAGRKFLCKEINDLLIQGQFSGILLPIDPNPVRRVRVPPTQQTIPLHASANGPDYLTYTIIANLCNLTAVSYPIRVSSDGFPIGVQIFAREQCEVALLKTAKFLEELLPNWIEPGELDARRKIFNDAASYAEQSII